MKRKDSKGRVLQIGEAQRADGRYEYKYTDASGKRKTAYSWRLTPSDGTPPGKKVEKSLREIEVEIRKNTEDGISPKKITFDELLTKYLGQKRNIKDSTVELYRYHYQKYSQSYIGDKLISKITYDDIKNMYSALCEVGLAKGTLKRLDSIIRPCFGYAVTRRWIRFNPCETILNECISTPKQSVTKVHALKIPQQESLIKYLNGNNKFSFWKQLIVFLLGTGCRIGEASALQWSDCDFENNLISINKTLIVYTDRNGKPAFCISTPKTENGVRTIPMLSDVKQVLLEERRKHLEKGRGKGSVILDGYDDFVFLNKKGNFVERTSFGAVLSRLQKDYNDTKDVVPIEKITAHMLRHTFCTRYCRVETNLKVIQEIMGHANISTTMKIYNEVFEEDKINSFKNLEGKIKIS